MKASEREAAWFEHQRKRWMRPDVERYLKPDWRERKYWNGLPASAAHLIDMAVRPHVRRAMDAPPPVDITEREIEAVRCSLPDLKEAVAQFSYALRWRAFRRALHCKYSPDQPRVPAGNPDGGQWTGSGGGRASERIRSQASDLSASRKAKGHHFVPRSLYRGLPLRPETRKVFDEGTTGRLHAEPHGWSAAHQAYNEAVDQHLHRFMETNNIRPDQMTPDQAQSFLREIKRSPEPRIRDYNTRIIMRELQYHFRRGPRRNE